MKIPWKKSPKVAILFFLWVPNVLRWGGGDEDSGFPWPLFPTLPTLTPSLQQWEAFPHFPKMPLKTPLVSTLPVPKTNSRHQTHHHLHQERTHTHAHMCYIPMSSTAQKKEGSKEQNSPTEKHKHISYFQYTASSGRKFLGYPEATLSRGISALSIGLGILKRKMPLSGGYFFVYTQWIPTGYCYIYLK